MGFGFLPWRACQYFIQKTGTTEVFWGSGNSNFAGFVPSGIKQTVSPKYRFHCSMVIPQEVKDSKKTHRGSFTCVFLWVAHVSSFPFAFRIRPLNPVCRFFFLLIWLLNASGTNQELSDAFESLAGSAKLPGIAHCNTWQWLADIRASGSMIFSPREKKWSSFPEHEGDSCLVGEFCSSIRLDLYTWSSMARLVYHNQACWCF